MIIQSVDLPKVQCNYGRCVVRGAHKLVVRLKGGLGNQMFQFAAALGVATRHGLDIIVDTRSGFARDRVYRRKFALGQFGLPGREANCVEKALMNIETLGGRYMKGSGAITKSRPWGLHHIEQVFQYHPELLSGRSDCNRWLDGYWQCERYFEDVRSHVSQGFSLPAPVDERFAALAAGIDKQNAVAIGIRLYEEAPVGSHERVPFEFYERMAERIAARIARPVFYLFCTVRGPLHGRLSLPGVVHYVTHDDGFTGELSRLWLLTQFKHHIISNSSFYWWGAWLAERQWPDVHVIASDNFPNPDTIPGRWMKERP